MARSMDIEGQLAMIMDEYNNLVVETVDGAFQKVAGTSVQKLRVTSPKRSGAYASNWDYRKDRKGKYIVFNHNTYRLTHLLNNGHLIKNKYGSYGHKVGDNHIKEVETWAISEAENLVEFGLTKGKF